MRLWHKDLIEVLPRQQLLGQWRECCLIAKNISKKGTPNHILVNKIMNYQINHFIYYSKLIYSEMIIRGYKCDKNKFTKYISCAHHNYPKYEELFMDWHNDRYLLQCYLNLQEKFDCNGITKEEFSSIRKRVYDVLYTGEQK